MTRTATRPPRRGWTEHPVRWGRATAQVLRSPFLAMPAWIGVVLMLYPLGWSSLQEPITDRTVTLLAVTAAAFLALALWIPTPRSERAARPLSGPLILLVTAYFVAAYVENGGIPVLLIASGASYDLYGFGVPGLHVLMLTLAGYQAVRAFRVILETRAWWAFLAFGWLGLLIASIANRSAVTFVVVACVVVLVRSAQWSRRWLAVLAVLVVGGVYAFGVLGSLRLSYQLEQITGTPATGDEILRVAGASDAFIDSGVSPAFLWGYTYVVSPAANLESAVEHAGRQPCGRTCDLAGLAVHELLPDVLSLRLGPLLEVPVFDKSPFLVSPSLTAATTFGSALGYAGLVGAFVVAAFLAVLSVAVVRLLRGSGAQEEGLAILATLLFFGFFENMWSYSALSLQLVFPLAVAVLPHALTSLPAWVRAGMSRLVPRRRRASG